MTLGPEKLRSIHSLSYLLINYFIQKPKLVTFSTVRLKYCSRPSFKAHSDLPQWSADSTVSVHVEIEKFLHICGNTTVHWAIGTGVNEPLLILD